MKVVSVGECLLELTHRQANEMHLNYAGDSYNTSYYLAQCNPAWQIHYLTALGTDEYSKTMLETWQRHGLNTQLCLQFDDKTPGLYLVNTDAHGERSFVYFRAGSAASHLFQHVNIEATLAKARQCDWLYLTGISFAILPETDRRKLIHFCQQATAHGVRIAFDNNYRAKLWQDCADAQRIAREMTQLSDIVFVTHDDEADLFADVDAKATLRRYQSWTGELVVVKDGPNRCFASHQGQTICQYPPNNNRVVDTTGAGDAFNAGFLSGYWQNQSLQQSLRKGHQLAAKVIQHPGAIVSLSDLEQMSRSASG